MENIKKLEILDMCLDKNSEEKEELNKILYGKNLEYREKDYSSKAINEFISRVDKVKTEQNKLDLLSDSMQFMIGDLFKQILSQVSLQMNLFEQSKIQILYNMFISYVQTLKNGDSDLVEQILLLSVKMKTEEILKFLEELGFDKSKRASDYLSVCKSTFSNVPEEILSQVVHIFLCDKNYELEVFYNQNELSK